MLCVCSHLIPSCMVGDFPYPRGHQNSCGPYLLTTLNEDLAPKNYDFKEGADFQQTHS